MPMRPQALGLAVDVLLQFLVQLRLAAAAKQQRGRAGAEDVPEPHVVYVRASTRLTPADSRSHFDSSVTSCFRPAFVSE